jgi:hypothetical protein
MLANTKLQAKRDAMPARRLTFGTGLLVLRVLLYGWGVSLAYAPALRAAELNMDSPCRSGVLYGDPSTVASHRPYAKCYTVVSTNE